MIKKYFMAGLAILLPIVLTLLITIFIVNLLTIPFQGVLQYFISKYQMTVLGSPEVVLIASKIAVLIALFFFVIALGFIARIYLIHYLFQLSDMLMTRIPLINKIYKSLQEVIKTLFSSTDTKSYSQVVLVPFPTDSSWAIGLITQADAPKGSDADHAGLISVYLPGMPNPTYGFMLLMKREQMIFIDMTVDEALRFVVSGGVMAAPFIKKVTSESQTAQQPL